MCECRYICAYLFVYLIISPSLSPSDQVCRKLTDKYTCICASGFIYIILYIYSYILYSYIYIPYLYIYSYIIYPYIQYSIYIHFRRHQSVQKLVALQRFEFEYALSPFPMVTLAVAQIWPCWHKMGKGGSEYPESTHK